MDTLRFDYKKLMLPVVLGLLLFFGLMTFFSKCEKSPSHKEDKKQVARQLIIVDSAAINSGLANLKRNQKEDSFLVVLNRYKRENDSLKAITSANGNKMSARSVAIKLAKKNKDTASYKSNCDSLSDELIVWREAYNDLIVSYEQKLAITDSINLSKTQRIQSDSLLMKVQYNALISTTNDYNSLYSDCEKSGKKIKVGQLKQKLFAGATVALIVKFFIQSLKK
jgi:hypothetical protein